MKGPTPETAAGMRGHPVIEEAGRQLRAPWAASIAGLVGLLLTIALGTIGALLLFPGV